MPKFIHNIISDLKQGKNVELYIFILLAIVISILDLFDIAKPNWITSITLIILALIIYGRIEDKRVMDRLFKKFNSPGNITFLEKYPDPFDDDLKTAKELWICGITLNRTISTFYTIFRTKLRNGDKIRILITKPDSPASLMATSRDRRSISPEYYDQTIKAVLKQFCALASEANADIEIKVSSNLLPFGFFAVNPNSENGVIYMQQYGYKIEEGDVPKMVLHFYDDWYVLYQKQLVALFNDAETWDCQSL